MKLPQHKCGLYLTHNQHKDTYQTVEEIINERPEWFNGDWATPTSKQRAIETDELWELQWYPDTPVGFNFVCGATLEEVLEKANH